MSISTIEIVRVREWEAPNATESTLASLVECERRMFFGGFSSIARVNTSPTTQQQAQPRALEAQADCAAHGPAPGLRAVAARSSPSTERALQLRHHPNAQTKPNHPQKTQESHLMSFAHNAVSLISSLATALLLSACATTPQEAPGPTAEEQAAARASQARSDWLEERERAIQALRSNPHLSVTELQHDEAVIRIRSGGLFRSASNTLTRAVKPIIDHIAQTLVEHPLLKIEVIGHTDNLGRPEHNLALSLQRAQAVHDALVSAGLDPTRASFSGRGDAEPITPNDTREGRAVNRRVDLLIAPFSYAQVDSDNDETADLATDPGAERPQ